MKWYWIVLIVIAAIAIGFFVAKAMKPKTTVKLGTTTGGVRPLLNNTMNPVDVKTETDAAGKKIVVASKVG